jgi:hypothetical protein
VKHTTTHTVDLEPPVGLDGPVPRLARIIDGAERELTPEEFAGFTARLRAHTAPLAHGTHPESSGPERLAALSPGALAHLVAAESVIASVAGRGSVRELAQVATCVQAHLRRALPQRMPAHA